MLGVHHYEPISFSNHLHGLNVKARTRIATLFHRIPFLKQAKLDIAIKIFDVYILSIYRYGLPLWINRCSKTRMEEMEAGILKSIKRYLGVQKSSNNAITYFRTSTEPLAIRLKKLTSNCTGGLSFPEKIWGDEIFFSIKRPNGICCNIWCSGKIPPWFGTLKQWTN